MTKYMLITPPPGFNIARKAQLGSHLVLAQHLQVGGTYRDFYKERSRRGHFLMLDNGAAEELELDHKTNEVIAEHSEQRLDFKEVWNLGMRLGVDEYILPDRKFDTDYTVRQTLYYRGLVPWKKRAVVPQGKTWQEWRNCLRELDTKMSFATICVTKDYEAFPGGRIHIMQYLEEEGYLSSHHIHWLGFKYNPRQEFMDAATHGVRSLDSGAPIAWAQNDKHFNAGGRYSLDWHKEFDRDLAESNVQELICT